MKRIVLKKEFRDDHITRAAGERLRHAILAVTNAGDKIEIDFDGLKIASTSFLDEGFAKLADEGWTSDKLASFVTLKNIYPRDKEILDDLFSRRASRSSKKRR